METLLTYKGNCETLQSVVRINTTIQLYSIQNGNLPKNYLNEQC